MTRDDTLNRRQFVKGTVAAGTAIAAAGCNQGGDGGDDGTDGNEDVATTDPQAALTVGDTVEGELTPDGPTDPVRGERAVPYSLETSQPQLVEISQESDDIDPYLVVTDENGREVARNDDGPDGLDSRITMTLTPGETYTVWAGTFSQADAGSFTLAVTDGPGISVGGSVTGQLRGDSPRDPVRNEPAVPYTLSVDEEQTVEISQESAEIDTYLVVTDGSGSVVAENDDGGVGFDSRLTTTLTPGETYTVWAGSFSQADTGSFTLSVSRISSAVPDRQERVSVGETVTGLIRNSSPRDPARNEPAVPYALSVDEAQTVEISQESDEIDTYLIVTDGRGRAVARNDDGADGLNSQLTMTLTPGETYTVWAGSFSRTETGRFTLSVRQISSGEPDRQERISVGETVTGLIRNSSPRDPVRREPAAPYTLSVDEAQTVVISQESDAIDPYLVVTDESGDVVARNDDGADGLNSRLTMTLTPGEVYTVWAGSFYRNETGSFRLSVRQISSGEPDRQERISVGESVTGLIRNGSPHDPVRNEPAVPYELSVDEAQTVEISQESDEIDCFLVVTQGRGREVARDDDGGTGFDSRLTVTLSPGERYTVWAGSYSIADTGPFTLAVSRVSAGVPDRQERISVGDSVRGQIRHDSPRDPVRNEAAVPYELSVDEEQSVEISQVSDEIDCFLVVTDESGREVARNDDGGSFLDSQLTTTLTPGETYTVWAGSYSSGETGSFTLSVERT